jgi:hypothetical protein
MDPFPYSAAEDHCFRALRRLALTEGTLQQRLEAAAFDLNVLWDSPDEWPPDSREAVAEIEQALTRGENQGEGTIRATVARMTDEVAQRWIIRILELSVGVYREAGAAWAKTEGA